MPIRNLVKNLLSNQFARNVSWMGTSELANRILRLGATITLARFLSPHDYGLAAIVLAFKEFAIIFTLKSGINVKLIQANEKELSILSNTSYWLLWIFCLAVFTVQCLIALPIALLYKDTQLIIPICIAGIEYLFFPFFVVQMALINRENRFKVVALASTLQSLVGNVSTALLAVLGFGMWAIIIPGIISTPIWFLVAQKAHSWRPDGQFTLHHWQEVIRFSKSVIGLELLDKTRANLDYLLVGSFLGISALGTYYFAFNAGLGISLNIINVLIWPLLAHLCAVRDSLEQLRNRYFSSLKTIVSIVIPFVLFQALLAPIYVPIIFGQKWIDAVPIMILICLSAIPRPFALAAGSLLTSVGRLDLDLKWNLVFTSFFAILLLIAAQWGILAVAASVLISHMIAIPIFSILATRYVFSQKFLVNN